MVHVGIDWSDLSHSFCILDDAGAKLDAFDIRHGLDGFETAHKRISKRAPSPEDVRVAIETKDSLIVDFFLELFSGLDSAEAVSFLSQYPTYHEARTVSESRIQSILRKQGFSDKTAAKRAKTTRTRSFWSLCPASHLPLVQCWQQSLALISRVSATSRPSKPLPDQAR